MAVDANGNHKKGTKKELPAGWVTFGFRYAILPSKEEASHLLRSFGCERKVFNEYIAGLYEYLETTDYEGGFINYKVPNYTTITEKFEFLDKSNDSFVYNDSKIRFSAAIKKYNEEFGAKPLQYKKSVKKKMQTIGYVPAIRDIKGMPKFHSKKNGKFSYTTNQTNGNISILEKEGECYLRIPKFKNGIKMIMHRPLPKDAAIKKATIKKEGDVFMVSLSVDFPLEKPSLVTAVEESKIFGIDYSQKDLYVDSNGETAKYPRFNKVIEKRQRRLNKSLARKKNKASRDENGDIAYSNNYKKELNKYQKTMTKAKNQRKDFLHKKSDQITNDYDAMVFEDLDLRNLAQCLSLGKKLHDNGFGMFRTMVKYKADKKGKYYIVADKFFASSKICSCCGHKKDDLKLSDRIYVCENCGNKMDRDHNAGCNLKQFGAKTLKTLGFIKQPVLLVK